MKDVEHDMNIEHVAASLFRLVHEKPWRVANEQERKNYMAVARKTVEDIKAEQLQQPAGQKEVA